MSEFLPSRCWAIDEDGYLSAIKFGSSFWDLPEPELMFELALVCKTLLTEKKGTGNEITG